MPDRRVLGLSPKILVAGLLGGAAAASGVALTATSGWLIVRADQRPQILTLLTAIVAVRTFGLSRPLFRYVERLRSHDAALEVLATRRAETYARLVPLTPARLGRRGRADLLTGVVDDLTDVTEAPVRVTVPVIGALAAGVVATALTAALEPLAGLVLVGMLLACAALVVLCHRVESAAQSEVLAARSEVTRVSHLATRHADDLRAISATGVAQGWVAEAHEALRREIARQSRGRALVSGGVLVITALATVACAWVAARSDASAPVRALLVLAPVATGEILGVLTDATRAMARASAGQRRIDGLLDQAPAVVDSPAVDHEAGAALRTTTRPPRIVLQDLTAGWTDERTDLGPASLTLEPGEHVAVVGANGAGKSTLLAVLGRHLDPTSGSYQVDDRDVLDLPAADVRALVAVVDDEPHVFASSLRENLRLARGPQEDPPSDDDLVVALRRAGLADWYQGLPDGLGTRLGVGGLGVSGGERSRLAIARALLSRRPVVLLDEPGAHLDHPTAESVISDLLRGADGRTVVIVSHHGVGTGLVDRVVDLERATSRRR